MKLLQSLFPPIVLAIVLTLVLAACGDSSSSSSGGYRYSGSSSSGTPTTNASTLRTASATVGGKTVTLLTNAQGMTLYYFQPDTATVAACTAGCASTWPPYLESDAQVPTSATSLPGALTIQANMNGQQVEYNAHPLYTYSGDTAPSQTNGEGIGNKWFVATTDLTMNKGNDNVTPTDGTYGGSGY
jgi:predicted lipoprotein with Yx(FWY)xxD motif